MKEGGICWVSFMALVAALLSGAGRAGEATGRPLLGEPPRALPGEATASLAGAGEATVHAAAVPAVDTNNRTAVVNFYNNVYLASNGVAHNWTGNVAAGIAGTLSEAYKDATIHRVNYFRAMAGLPGDITRDPTLDAKCQQAALMFSANQDLSHTPPPSWLWYTAEGADAASHSNIAGDGGTGAAAVDLYMGDPGASNYFLGHRRWVLYPPRKIMGTGSIPTGDYPSDALWVTGTTVGTRPATPDGVAWPPAGYVPYQLVDEPWYNRFRWSFSYNEADFSGASVTMFQGATPVTVEEETYVGGYGDNTLAWWPDIATGSPPAVDTTYRVNVWNVLVGGTPTNFIYDVTIIDPAAVPAEPPDTPTGLTASNGTFLDRVTLGWNPADGADGYDVYRNTVNNSSTADFIGSSATTDYNDFGTIPGTTYYYWVASTRSLDGATSGLSVMDTGWAAVTPGADPVYRFWSAVLQVHFYTVDAAEKALVVDTWPGTWAYEGIAYYGYTVGHAVAGTEPVYRFWSDVLFAHFYTMSPSERDYIIAVWPDAWAYEGVAFYAWPLSSPPAGTSPVYRFWSDFLGAHFYTINEAEKNFVIATWPDVWSLEGPAWYGRTAP